MNKINKEEIEQLLKDLAANVGYVLISAPFDTPFNETSIKRLPDSKQFFWTVPASVLNDKEHQEFRKMCINADIIDTVCITSFPFPSNEENQIAIILVDLTCRRRGCIKFVDASRWNIADETGMAAVCNMLIHDLFPGEDFLAFRMNVDVMDIDVDNRWDEQVRLVSEMKINNSLSPQNYILKPTPQKGFKYVRLDEIFFIESARKPFCYWLDQLYSESLPYSVHDNILELRECSAIVVSAYGNLQPQKVIPKGNSVSVDLNEKIALIPMWWANDIDLDYLVEYLNKESTLRQLPFLPYPDARLKDDHLSGVLIEIPEKIKVGDMDTMMEFLCKKLKMTKEEFLCKYQKKTKED
jgi:hypothetical protein